MFFPSLFQVMCSISLLLINLPLRRLKKSVKTRTPGWRQWGSSKQLGGMALTSAIMGGYLTPAFATLWLWPGPSVEVVYLGWEPCIVLRTRQASLPLIADLMPTALNVSVWYLFKNYRFLKNTSKTCIGVHLAMGMDSMSCSVCTERKQFTDFQKPINGAAVIWLKQQEVWQMDVLLEMMRICQVTVLTMLHCT